MPRRPLTTPEAAAILGVAPATLRSWKLRGQGPDFIQPGGPGTQPLYLPEVVELFKLRRDEAKQRKG